MLRRQHPQLTEQLADVLARAAHLGETDDDASRVTLEDDSSGRDQQLIERADEPPTPEVLG